MPDLNFYQTIEQALKQGMREHDEWQDKSQYADFEYIVTGRIFENLRPVVKALMAEASATALEDIDNYIDQVLFPLDEETNTGPLVGGRGPLVCLFRDKAKQIREKAGIVDTEV